LDIDGLTVIIDSNLFAIHIEFASFILVECKCVYPSMILSWISDYQERGNHISTNHNYHSYIRHLP
jgi:hypothetical protein